MESPINSVYKHELESIGINATIGNINTKVIVKNSDSIISATPFKLGSIVTIGTDKYMVTEYKKQFNQSIYNRGIIQKATSFTINNNTIYGIVNYINGVTTGNELFELIADKYAFKIPYFTVSVNDIITYRNMNFKVDSIDYSQSEILTLYADYNGIADTFTIRIAESNISIDKDNTYQINAICSKNGTIVENPTIIYSSNNIDVVTVDDTGLVVGLTEGNAIITCNYNGVYTTLSVSVKEVATAKPIKIVMPVDETKIQYDEANEYYKMLTGTYTISVINKDGSEMDSSRDFDFKAMPTDMTDISTIINNTSQPTHTTWTFTVSKTKGFYLYVEESIDSSINDMVTCKGVLSL